MEGDQKKNKLGFIPHGHGRPKADFRSGGLANYKGYKEKYPDTKLKSVDFHNLVIKLNQGFIDYCLKTGEGVKLPFGFGILTVARYKSGKPKLKEDGTMFSYYPVNWNESNKQGKIVYFINNHTGGNVYRWKWLPTTARFKHAIYWKLSILKKNKKLLHEHIMDEENNYREKYREIEKYKKK